MPSIHELGLVTSPQIRVDDENEKIYILSFSDADDERVRLRISRGVAQSLWHELSKHLFPRAAENLTRRASTADMKSLVEDRDTAIAVVVEPVGDSGVQLTVTNVDEHELIIQFSKDDGEILWGRLEDLFNMMHSGRDHYRHKE